MNGTASTLGSQQPPPRLAKPPPTGPAPPAPSPSHALPHNHTHNHTHTTRPPVNGKGKKKGEPVPVDPAAMVESLKNRIAALEEDKVIEEEEEKRFGEIFGFVS